MSHRNVYSQGSIPFSWEDSPGVSKIVHHALNLSSSTTLTQFRSHLDHHSDMVDDYDDHQDIVKILPLPPCPRMVQHPRRSSSSKGFWWLLQEDPFLAAYKECTKKNINVRRDQGNLGGGLISKKIKFVGSSKKAIRKSKNILSCKTSCDDDVQENNLVMKLPKLHPLPARGTKFYQRS